MKKIKINLDYISPNSSFIYPLFTEENNKILNERVPLTGNKIIEIKRKYGNILYYHDHGEGAIIPNFRLKIAYNKSKQIMEEISVSQKFSRTTFREAEKVIEEVISHLNSSEIEAIELLKFLKSHDEYLYTHSVNVGVLCAVFSKLIGSFTMDDIKNITLGAYLIDIGAMMVDEQLLSKEGKYDITDMKKMKRHPQLGYELLKKFSGVSPVVLQAVLFHHEKFNNNGYYKMPFDNLPITPKIVSLCDVYDALTSKRPYRNEISPAMTLKIMFNLINHNFEYKLTNEFINKLGLLLNNAQSFYKRNDFCELNNNELAVIKNIGVADLLKPKVFVFCKFEKQNGKLSVKFYERPIEIDLQKDTSRSITKFINNSRQIETISVKLKERNILSS